MPKIKNVILLLMISRGYDRALLHGIAKYSRLHGPWTFYREPLFYRRPGRDKDFFSKLRKWDADGLIMREPKRSKELISIGLPTVVSPYSKERVTGLPNIVSDNASMAKMAAEHLLDRGFQNFAYCGFDDMFFSQDRGKKLSKYLAQAGFKTHFYKQPQAKTYRLWENEQRYMVEWLQSLPQPVGVIACNDDRSQHIIEACAIAGLHIPEQIAVIGIDNDELICNLSNPPLSSIAINAERAGYEAAAVLDQLMKGKKKVKETITVSPTHVVPRQSTDILAIEDSEVAEAVRFIRQHAKKPIQVNDIVEVIAVSRRSIEQRFRRILNRSVHDEIKRTHTDQVARLLVETHMSIAEIAKNLGYPGVQNISRYFRQEKGMTLLTYRKKYGHK